MTNSSSVAAASSSALHVEQQHYAQPMTSVLNKVEVFALFAFAGSVSLSIAGAHISLGLLTLCLLGQSAWRRAQRSKGEAQLATENWPLKIGFEWPLLVFVIVALISTALSELPLTSFRNLRHLLTILGAYTVAFSLRRQPQWRQPLLWTFIGVATLASIWGLLEYTLGLSRKVQSTQGTTMTWGALCVMFMSFTLQMALAAPTSRERWFARAQFIPQFFAMLFSLVRGAYVGFASSIIYLLKPYWSNRRLLLRKILPALLLLVITTTLISPQNVQQRFAAIFDLNTGSTQVRLIQWKHALTIAADHPVFGVGWRDLQAVLRQYAVPDPNIPENITKDVFSIGHFHSNYFTILVCFGVTGLLAFACLMLAVWRALGVAIKNTHDENGRLVIFASRAALLGFLVAGIFDWTFGDAEVVTMLWFVVGLGCGQVNFKNTVATR